MKLPKTTNAHHASSQQTVPLQGTLSILQEGIAILDKKGIVVFLNEVAKMLFQRRLGKHPQVGDRYLDFVHPSRKKATREYIKDALAGKGFDFTLKYPQDGVEAWFTLGYYPIHESKGRITHVCVKAKEITDKMELKQKLRVQKRNEQARLVNAIMSAQEKERLNIGHELHDNVNQVLATVKLYLEVMMTSDETNRSLVQKAIQRVSYAIDEIRRISHNLSSPELTGLSLTVQLQELCDSVAAAQHLGMHFLTYGVNDAALTIEIKTALYRVAQQQLANIMRHAKASSVEVMLVGGYNSIALRISDNGQGVDLTKSKDGIGLVSMRSRVEALQGSMQLESAPGKGFQLMVELPIV
jgi:PAS domain S-box-containing protein